MGAILSDDRKTVKLLGFGVYEGDFVPHEGAPGWMTKLAREAGRTNPRIRLDSGRVVYGCQCYWATEAHIQKRLEGCAVEHVVLEDEPAAPAASSSPADA